MEWLRAEPEVILDRWHADARKLVRSLGLGGTEGLREVEDLLHEAVVKLLESRSDRYRRVQVELGEAQAAFGGFVRWHYANLRRRKAGRERFWHELREAVERALLDGQAGSGRPPRGRDGGIVILRPETERGEWPRPDS